jgi:cytochrome oxidase Cu insertion factor (SCO1/SenC/PrrC family)
MKASICLAGLLLLVVYTGLAQDRKTAHIYIRNAGVSDTIRSSYWDDLLTPGSVILQDSHKTNHAGPEADLIIPITSSSGYTYCQVGIAKKRLTGVWPVQAGDAITIDLSAQTPRFTGKGAARYRYYRWLDSMYNDWSHRVDSVSEALPAGMRREYAYPRSQLNDVVNWQRKINKARDELERIRHELSEQDYTMLQAELIGKAEEKILYATIFYCKNFPASFPEKDRDSLVAGIKAPYFQQRSQYMKDSARYPITSIQYCSWLLEEAKRAQELYQQFPLYWITSTYKGELKNRLAVALLFQKTKNMDDADHAAFTAAISNPYYHNMASAFLSRIKKGAPAFPFVLRNTEGKTVQLEDFRGKLLIMDFWFTGCSGCVAIAPVLEQIAASFTANDPIRFVSVSLDTDRQKWLESIRSGKYASKGFAHVYTNGLGYDYPMISYYSLHAMPSLVIVDADGRFISMNEPREYTKKGIEEYISFLRQAMPHKE